MYTDLQSTVTILGKMETALYTPDEYGCVQPTAYTGGVLLRQ